MSKGPARPTNAESFVSFGEQGAQLTYGSYLRLPQLLDAQHLESGHPPAHDELLFITIHQVYELWFQQLLHEVTAAREAMMSSAGDQLWWAQHLLARVHVIERLLVHQIDVLETMTPQDFLEFRQRLWEAFLHVVRTAGLPADTDAAVLASLRTAAHDRSRYAVLWALAEALLQHDELAASWRARHVVMVERMIGGQSGTAGSSGASYLHSRLALRYYPLLWDLRSEL